MGGGEGRGGEIPVPRLTNCMNAHTRGDTCVASRAEVSARVRVCVRPLARASRGLAPRRRRPGARVLHLRLSPFPRAPSPNHSHVRRLQKCPATFPRERFPDRSPATQYTDSISALQIRAETLNGRADISRQSWNFKTTRPKG